MVNYKKREKKFYKLSELATVEQIQWFESLFDKLKLYSDDYSIKYKMIIENDLNVTSDNFYSALYYLFADCNDEVMHFGCPNIEIADSEEEFEKLKNKEMF